MSQAPQSFGNDDFSTPKQGMSGTTKVLLGLGVGCGVVVLLCCGGFVALSMWGASIAEKSAVTEPAEVDAIAQSVATVDVPAELKPRMGMDVTIPFVGPLMKMAIYSEKEDSEHDNALIIGEWMPEPYKPGATGPNEEFRQAMREQGQDLDNEDMETIESHEMETTVRDQPAHFIVSKLKAADSDKEIYQAMGAFAGEKGTGFFMLVVDAEKFSQEQVEAVVNSIK